jgi:hypothetical protein
MGITALDLGGWIFLYFGIGLVRASLPCSRADSADYDLTRKLAGLGYCLLVVGAVVLGIGMLRPFY